MTTIYKILGFLVFWATVIGSFWVLFVWTLQIIEACTAYRFFRNQVEYYRNREEFRKWKALPDPGMQQSEKKACYTCKHQNEDWDYCEGCGEGYTKWESATESSDEFDKDDDFQCCDNCDLPDACADFGCAIKAGIRKV